MKTLEDLAGLITVPNILECLGGVLSADVEKNLLSASADVLACGPLNEFEIVSSNSKRRVKLGRMVRLSCWRPIAYGETCGCYVLECE